MMTSFLSVFYLVAVLAVVMVQANMYYRPPPSKTIHVHHYDAGMTGGHMGNYKKFEHGGGGGGGGGGSSLIELLILSSLLGGGGGLFGNNANNNAIPIGIPIQQPIPIPIQG